MLDIIGMNVREARLSRGWSQRFVASQLNISHQSISRIENGYPVSSYLLKKVVGLLQISSNDLCQNPKEKETLKYIIPDNSMSKMILSSQPLLECIFQESILIYKIELKQRGILVQEDIKNLIVEYLGKKVSYSTSDLIYIGMLANQETLKKAMLYLL